METIKNVRTSLARLSQNIYTECCFLLVYLQKKRRKEDPYEWCATYIELSVIGKKGTLAISEL